MVMSMGAVKNKKTYIVASGVLPQTLSVIRMRAKGFNINVLVGNPDELLKDEKVAKDLCGVLVQYPDVDGDVKDWEALAKKVHQLGGQVTAATDLLALTMLKVRLPFLYLPCRPREDRETNRTHSDLSPCSPLVSGEPTSSLEALPDSVSLPVTEVPTPPSLPSETVSSARCPDD